MECDAYVECAFNLTCIFNADLKVLLYVRVHIKTVPLKFHILRGCLQVKFHPGMKLVPGWNHPCLWSMVKCLLLFTRFCRDEISSRDERQGWDFILGWKKEKKTCKHFIPGWNFKMSMFLINFWRMHSNMLSKVNVFEHNESTNIMKHKASL